MGAALRPLRAWHPRRRAPTVAVRWVLVASSEASRCGGSAEDLCYQNLADTKQRAHEVPHRLAGGGGGARCPGEGAAGYARLILHRPTGASTDLREHGANRRSNRFAGRCRVHETRAEKLKREQTRSRRQSPPRQHRALRVAPGAIASTRPGRQTRACGSSPIRSRHLSSAKGRSDGPRELCFPAPRGSSPRAEMLAARCRAGVVSHQRAAGGCAPAVVGLAPLFGCTIRPEPAVRGWPRSLFPPWSEKFATALAEVRSTVSSPASPSRRTRRCRCRRSGWIAPDRALS